MVDGFDHLGTKDPVPSGRIEQKEVEGLSDFLSLHAWVDRDIPAPDRLLGDLVTTTTRIFLVGRTGLGKTMFGFAIACGMATGDGFLHWRCDRPVRVLYIDGEMPGELIKERSADVLRRSGAIGPNPRNLMIFSRDAEAELAKFCPTLPAFAPLNTDAGKLFVLGLIAAVGGVDVVMFDNVMSLVEGDQKDEVPWSDTLPLVASLTSKRVGQIWLDHTGHNTDRQYGSATKAWRFDAVGVMTPLAGQTSGSPDLAFTLTFDYPGKARRRTPNNSGDFQTHTIRLREDRWTSECADDVPQRGSVAPGRRVYHDAMLAVISSGLTVGPGRITKAAWENACVQRNLMTAKEGYTGKERDRTQDFRRAISDLRGARWISVEDGVYLDLTRPYRAT